MGHRGIINWYNSALSKHKPRKAALWIRAASWNHHQQLREEFTPGLNHFIRAGFFFLLLHAAQAADPHPEDPPQSSPTSFSTPLYTQQHSWFPLCYLISSWDIISPSPIIQLTSSLPTYCITLCGVLSFFDWKSESISGLGAAQVQNLLLR